VTATVRAWEPERVPPAAGAAVPVDPVAVLVPALAQAAVLEKALAMALATERDQVTALAVAPRVRTSVVLVVPPVVSTRTADR
jgi:hypothetical protein